jgi:predicted double-glycine peptidase
MSNSIRKRARALQFAAALVGLSATASAQAAGVDLPSDVAGGRFVVGVKSLKQTFLEMRFRTTIPQQFDYSCGAAALATLLTFHYGRPVPEGPIIMEMYARGDQPKIRKEGFSMLDMKVYLEAHGYSADGFEIGPDQFDQLVGENVPFIALIKDGGYNHFVVVKGAAKDAVLVGDPAKGARILPRREFERMWDGRIAFLIHSHQDIAQFNVPEQWRVVPQVGLTNFVTTYDNLTGMMLMRPGRNDF